MGDVFQDQAGEARRGPDPGLPPAGSSSPSGENLSSESGVWSINQPSPTSSLCQAEF